MTDTPMLHDLVRQAMYKPTDLLLNFGRLAKAAEKQYPRKKIEADTAKYRTALIAADRFVLDDALVERATVLSGGD